MAGEQREELIDALDHPSGGCDELPAEVRERLLDGMTDELITGRRGKREIFGQDAVLGEITRPLVQRSLAEELTEHVGCATGQAPPGGVGISRNGGTRRCFLTDRGRCGSTPQGIATATLSRSVRKGQRRLAGPDEKIVGPTPAG
jgi:hypothetical protein